MRGQYRYVFSRMYDGTSKHLGLCGSCGESRNMLLHRSGSIRFSLAILHEQLSGRGLCERYSALLGDSDDLCTTGVMPQPSQKGVQRTMPFAEHLGNADAMCR